MTRARIQRIPWMSLLRAGSTRHSSGSRVCEGCSPSLFCSYQGWPASKVPRARFREQGSPSVVREQGSPSVVREQGSPSVVREQGLPSSPLWSQCSGIAIDEPVFPLFNAVAGWTVREQERKASSPAWKSYWQDLFEHPFRPSSALDDVFHLWFQIGDRGVHASQITVVFFRYLHTVPLS